jgi:hypothetical protein
VKLGDPAEVLDPDQQDRLVAETAAAGLNTELAGYGTSAE